MNKLMVEFIEIPGANLVVGQEVFISNVEEQGTETALAITNMIGDKLAYAVAAEKGLSQNNLTTGEELFNNVPEDKRSSFKGRIQSQLQHGRFAVEVDLSQFSEKQTTTQNAGRKEFELKVAGSVRDYKAKNAVIKAFRSGVKVQVVLTAGSEEDNGVELAYDGMLTDRRGNPAKAGVIRTNDVDELKALQELIEAVGEIKGVVTDAEDSSYTLSVVVDQSIVQAVEAGEPIPDIENVKERLVNEGIRSAEVIDDVVEMLKHYGVDTQTIIDVLETFKDYGEYNSLVPSKPKTQFIDENYFIFDSIAYVMEKSRRGIRFVGPKGTGKNLLEEWLGYLMQRPLFDQPITIDTDKYELLGSKTADVVIDENGNGSTKIIFDPENLIKAMEVGGFINMDEVNMASAAVLALLNPVLDRRSYIDVSGYGRVVAHDNFMMFATMNEAYAGTQELNAATQDRFATLIFDANETIMPILDSHEDTKDADKSDKNIANQLFEGMSRMIKGQDLSKDAETIRGFIAAVSIAKRIGIRRGLIQNVVNNINDEDTRQQVRDFIDTII